MFFVSLFHFVCVCVRVFWSAFNCWVHSNFTCLRHHWHHSVSCVCLCICMGMPELPSLQFSCAFISQSLHEVMILYFFYVSSCFMFVIVSSSSSSFFCHVLLFLICLVLWHSKLGLIRETSQIWLRSVCISLPILSFPFSLRSSPPSSPLFSIPLFSFPLLPSTRFYFPLLFLLFLYFLPLCLHPLSHICSYHSLHSLLQLCGPLTLCVWLALSYLFPRLPLPWPVISFEWLKCLCPHSLLKRLNVCGLCLCFVVVIYCCLIIDFLVLL